MAYGLRGTQCRLLLNIVAVCLSVMAVIGEAKAEQVEKKRTTSGPAYVFLLAGASNAGGVAKWDEVSPEDRAKLTALSAQTKLLDHKAISNVSSEQPQLAYSILAPRLTDGGYKFGPEMSFGASVEFYKPAENVYIIKYTEGGSSIDQWLGEFWPDFSAFVKAGLRAIPEPYEIRGFAWIQDGPDAGTLENAQTYEADTRKFLQRVRTLVKSPELPIVLVEEPNEESNHTDACLELFTQKNSYPYMSIIHQAKLNIVADMKHVSYVSSANYTFNVDDCVHFDAATQIALGRTLGKRFRNDQLRSLESAH